MDVSQSNYGTKLIRDVLQIECVGVCIHQSRSPTGIMFLFS